nr:LPXTG cell wall anchor domain-containing protein [Auraticoccus cholistanensis]
MTVALGVAAVVAGGADDSPGLQLLGVLLAVGGVVLAVRSRRRRT